jgi:hypothetical protein
VPEFSVQNAKNAGFGKITPRSELALAHPSQFARGSVGQYCPSADPIATFFEPDFTYQDFSSIKQQVYDLD